jgi:hypothetical protein
MCCLLPIKFNCGVIGTPAEEEEDEDEDDDDDDEEESDDVDDMLIDGEEVVKASKLLLIHATGFVIANDLGGAKNTTHDALTETISSRLIPWSRALAPALHPSYIPL